MKSKEDIDKLCEEQHIVEKTEKLDDGTPILTYENVGDFESFRCYWCLSKFKTWEESRKCPCDKSGEAAQMVR